MWGWFRNRMVSKLGPHDTNRVGRYLLPRVRSVPSHPVLSTVSRRPTYHKEAQVQGQSPQVHTQAWHPAPWQSQAGQALTDSLKTEEGGLDREVGTGAERGHSWQKE